MPNTDEKEEDTPTPEEIKKLLEAKKKGKEAFAEVMKEIWKSREEAE
jgi:hypothetical protein